jgi:cytoskeletal protein RodZ
MYEQNEVPVFRRIVWLVLWFVVIIAVIWLLVWFIFFRSPSSEKSGTESNKNGSTSQGVQDTATNGSSSSSDTSGTTPGSSSSQSSGSSSSSSSSESPSTSTNSTATTGQQPNELVNTGAGDIIVPFVAATFIGSTLYYIRTAKKLSTQSTSDIL